MEFNFDGSPMTSTDAMMLGDDYFLSLMGDKRAKPDALTTAAAAWRTFNPISSTVDDMQMREAFEGKDGFKDVEGYNVYDSLEDRYWDDPELFSRARSPEEAAFIKAKIDSERRNRRILDEAGGMGIFMMMAAGTLDPITAPIGLLGGAGFGAIRGAFIGAAAVTAEVAAQELILQDTQLTRTWQESMWTVGTAPLFGSVFGAIGGAMTKSQINKAMKIIHNDLDDIAHKGGLRGEKGESIGAASKVGTLDEEQPIGWQGPAVSSQLRLLDSESPTAVNFINRTSRHDFISGKNMKGGETEVPMEVSLVRETHQSALRVMDSVAVSYKEYIGSASKTAARLRGRLQKGTLNLPEFRIEIGKAMRKGDVHANPHVQTAARKIRILTDEHLVRMKAVDMLPDNIKPKFAKSYLTRIYNVKAIRNNRSDWDEMLKAHFIGKGLDKLEAEKAAGDVTDHILIHGTNPTKVEPGLASPTRERTLDIDDTDLIPFLVNDVETVMDTYLRKTLPQLHWLETHGTLDVTDILQKVKDEYRLLIKKAKEGKKYQKVVKRLEEKLQRDIIDITNARDLYLGRYNMPKGLEQKITNASRGLRGLTVVGNLGSMTLAAQPDVGMVVFKQGMLNTGRAFIQFTSSMSKSSRVSRVAMTDAGIASEMTLGSRILSVTDLEDSPAWMRKGLTTFSNVALMGPWNYMMKTVAGFAAQNRIIKGVFNYDGLSDLRRGIMASNGIGDYTAKIMREQVEQFGEKFRGGWIPNTEKWTDRVLARKFDDIIFAQTEMSIVTPGMLDKPTMMHKEMGRLLLMFKSFMFAAHHQILLPLVQRLPMADVQALNGMFISGSLAMYATWARFATSGRLDELDDYTAADWAREAVDRAGWVALPIDGINMVDRLTGGEISKRVGLKEGSKYFYKDKMGLIIGPAGATASGMLNAMSNLISADGMTASDIHGIRRILPYQNLFYTRWLFNQAEQAAAQGRTGDRRRR